MLFMPSSPSPLLR
jgi:hypothetical protein